MESEEYGTTPSFEAGTGDARTLYGYKVAYLRVINGTPQIVSHSLSHVYKIDADAECMISDHPVPDSDCTCGFHLYSDQESAEAKIRPDFQNLILRVVGSLVRMTPGDVYRCYHQRVESITVSGCFVSTCNEIPIAFLEDDDGWLNGVCVDHSIGVDPMKLWTLGAVAESLSSNNSVRRQVRVFGVLAKPGIETLQSQQIKPNKQIDKDSVLMLKTTKRRKGSWTWKVIPEIFVMIGSMALILLMMGVF